MKGIRMLQLMIDEKTGKLRKAPLIIIIFLLVGVFTLTLTLNARNTKELISYTEESIKDELIAIGMAAVEIIDPAAIQRYTSMDRIRADLANYNMTRGRLRQLVNAASVEYVYVIKEIGGEYYFIYDTDTENEEVFIPYELSDVHKRAFNGERAADVLNIQDEYGTFNGGAVPIYHNGDIIAIMCVDASDMWLKQSRQAATRNQVILAVSIATALCLLMAFLVYLLHKVAEMQETLHAMAHKDTITGLPNRLYLLEYLEEHTRAKRDVPFALMFIDLDNFKRVNDLAGHDAGDELLRNVGDFLKEETRLAETFHPSAGYINVSARVGGDEFIQVYPGVDTIEEADKLAQHLFATFAPERVSRYIEKYNVSLSIGVALYPYHSANYHTLIKYADTAMYVAKKAGKNQYRLYADGMVGEEQDPDRVIGR